MGRDRNIRRRRRRMIAAMEAGDPRVDDVKERKAGLRRWVARVSWGLDHMDRLDRAQEAADAAWARLETEDPDGEGEPPEQAELERLLKDADALIDHGRWPRHLHWSV